MKSEEGPDTGVEKPGQHDQEPQNAGSALRLLRSLTRAEASPENLEKAFLDWSQLSDTARSNPEFDSILTSLMAGGVKSDPTATLTSPFPSASFRKFDLADVFFLNEKGVVIDISDALSHLLDVKLGDTFRTEDENDLAEPRDFSFLSDDPVQTIEVRDRFAIKRRIILHRAESETGSLRFAGVYVRVALSGEAERELSERYGLTRSELEILGLALQRYKPEHIAKLRASKLNTVRTHISRLIQKMECHSLSEAVGSAIELSMTINSDASALVSMRPLREDSTRKVTIPDHNAVVEYARYGPVSGRPVIVLHSLEYGFEPTPEFVGEAEKRDVCLYFPRRPGFGGSTPVVSVDTAASILGHFLRVLNISGATMVALSTAAPFAVAIQEQRGRIDQFVLVNYGLNAKGKIDVIEPKWIRGMIRMAMAAPSSFAAGLEAVRTFFRTFGTERFYRMLYSTIDVDLQFMEQHEAIFERSGEIMIKANRVNIRLDIMAAFMKNPDLPRHLATHRSVIVANGSEQHMVSPDEAIISADNMNVRFELVPGGGRNWPFEKSGALFDLIEQDTEV